jgi:hypothetical protein
MIDNFTYETAIVAASGRGIGKETAMLLLNMGLNVVVIVITPVTTIIVGFNEKNICFIITHSSQHRLCISSPFFWSMELLRKLV